MGKRTPTARRSIEPGWKMAGVSDGRRVDLGLGLSGVRLPLWLVVVMVLLMGGCSSSPATVPSAPAVPTSRAARVGPGTSGPAQSGEEGVRALLGGADEVPPITGYGDFSGVDWYELDVYAVAEAEAACLRDHGYPVTILPPGNGISFAGIPQKQQAEAAAVLQACDAGLNLPAYHPPDRATLERLYRKTLETADCLRREGYDVGDAPSMETWVESWPTGPWSPYDSIPPSVSDDEWDRLNVACPQQ